MEIGLAVLSSLVAHIPVYVAWAVAVVFAVARWNKHPQISLYVVLAVAGMLFLNVFATAFGVVMPLRMRENGMTAHDIGVYFSIEGGIVNLMSAGLWGLLIAAIFGWRNPSPSPQGTLSSGA